MESKHGSLLVQRMINREQVKDTLQDVGNWGVTEVTP